MKANMLSMALLADSLAGIKAFTATPGHPSMASSTTGLTTAPNVSNASMPLPHLVATTTLPVSLDLERLATDTSYQPILTFIEAACTPWCEQLTSDDKCAKIYGCGYNGGDGSAGSGGAGSLAVASNRRHVRTVLFVFLALAVVGWG